jgi:hypothetical protein
MPAAVQAGKHTFAAVVALMKASTTRAATTIRRKSTTNP